MASTKIFYATDVHGSDVCWRKFLNAGPHYGADVLVLGGDMTGKAIVPIVERNGRHEVTLGDHRYELDSDEEVRAIEKQIADQGYYPVRMSAERVTQLGEDEGLVDELFEEQMLGTVERWMEIAEEKLSGTGIRCFVCPGNDDVFEVDEVIASSDFVEIGEARIVDVGGFEMASMGWTNPTPWDTHRETSEEELRARIDKMVSGIDAGRAVFNFHAPPHGSSLDDAPDLDENLEARQGGRVLKPAGSTAVRDSIMEYQPLLSLHGHIHEGRGAVRLGKTLSVNPGSAYEEGVLQGAIVDLDDRKSRIRNYVLVEG
jgi:uncharacterized protein